MMGSKSWQDIGVMGVETVREVLLSECEETGSP